MNMALEDKVGTIWGPFDRERAKALRAALDEAPESGLIQFEGDDLDIKFGTYLLEFVELHLRDYR